MTLIEPSFAPSEDSSITMPEIEIAVGSVTVTKIESEQPLVESDTTQVYVPADKPVTVAIVWPLDQA